MMTPGVILWVMFLAWLVSSLYPSPEMRRDPSGKGVYYGVWALLFGSVLPGHYHFMAQSSHAVLALISDIPGVGLGAVCCWGRWRCRQQDTQLGQRVSSHLLHSFCTHACCGRGLFREEHHHGGSDLSGTPRPGILGLCSIRGRGRPALAASG